MTPLQKIIYEAGNQEFNLNSLASIIDGLAREFAEEEPFTYWKSFVDVHVDFSDIIIVLDYDVNFIYDEGHLTDMIFEICKAVKVRTSGNEVKFSEKEFSKFEYLMT